MMLKHLTYAKACFFVAEEVGCQGSSNCDITFFNDSQYVIQSDRRDNKDFLCTASGTQLNGDEFQARVKDAVIQHDMEIAHNGGLTDVVQLRNMGMKACAVNIASGYFRPHFHDEVVVIADVANTLSLVFELVAVLGTDKWEYTPPPKPAYKSTYDYGRAYDEWDSYGYDNVWTPKSYTPTPASASIHNKHEEQNYWDASYEKLHDSHHCADCWKDVEDDSKLYCDECTSFYMIQYGLDPNYV